MEHSPVLFFNINIYLVFNTNSCGQTWETQKSPLYKSSQPPKESINLASEKWNLSTISTISYFFLS